MSEVLKPCPFCGKDPDVDESRWSDPAGGAAKSMFRVICHGCGTSQTPEVSYEDAAKIWNRRFPAARNVDVKEGTVTIARSEYDNLISERALLLANITSTNSRLNKIQDMIQRFLNGKAVSSE